MNQTYTTGVGQNFEPVSIQDLKDILAKIPPPLPRRTFVHDGAIHGVYDHGEMRVSPALFEIIRTAAAPTTTSIPRFDGMPIVIDETLPRPIAA
jgi:hypothetical protein